MAEDYGPVVWLDHKADVEEPILELGMTRLRGGDHVRVPLSRESAQRVCLRARDVDRALARELHMVGVEDLVGESLETSLRNADQTNRKIHAREPTRSLDQVRDVLDVPRDLLAFADSSHRLDQADGLVWLAHRDAPCPGRANSTASVRADDSAAGQDRDGAGVGVDADAIARLDLFRAVAGADDGGKAA